MSLNFEHKNSRIFLEGAEGEKFEGNNLSPPNSQFQIVNFYREDDNFGYIRPGKFL